MEGDGREKRRRTEEAVRGAPGLEDNEEEQVEKFFALLRSVRELRQQQRKEGGEGAAGKRPKVDGSVAWTPTFQWEDFAVVVGNDGAGATREAGAQEERKGEEEGSSLDLRLSL